MSPIAGSKRRAGGTIIAIGLAAAWLAAPSPILAANTSAILDTGGTRLVMTWTHVPPAAACFERPGGALVLARDGDMVEEGEGQLEGLTPHGVEIVRLVPDGAGGWLESRANWPIAGYVPLATLQRCQQAHLALGPKAIPNRTHALLPPEPDRQPTLVIRDATHLPPGWRITAPETSADRLLCANNSRSWYAVAVDAGALRVTGHVERRAAVLVLADGELVGFDFGEFGGRIEWVGHDGAREVVVDDVNPVVMIQHGDDVLVATGLSHLSLDHGDIQRLHRGVDGEWRARKWLDLGAAPAAGYLIDENTWRLVTTQGVLDVHLDSGTTQAIHVNANWGMLYPTSIAPLGDAWFIGARQVVFRLAPGKDGLEEQWLSPGACEPRR
ncbi:MAG: hypothetical protein ACREO3_10855 [Arenimonas sp.]